MSTALAHPAPTFVPVAPVATIFPGFQHELAKRTPNEMHGAQRALIIQRGTQAFTPWLHRTIYLEPTQGYGHRQRLTKRSDPHRALQGLYHPARIGELTPVGLRLQWLVPFSAERPEDFAGLGLSFGSRETLLWADWFTESWRFWAHPQDRSV
ncbi:MAG: hypothetical protein M0Z36_09845 [Thermaerobacter sp.]|nr:hypothetical protein [Thermaerobacter sp.]